MCYATVGEWRKKKHTIISTDAEKGFDKIQYPFMIKQLTKNRKKPPQYIKNHTGKCHSYTIFNGERLKAFPLRWGRRQEWLISPLLFKKCIRSSSQDN